MITLYKQSALSPISVSRSSGPINAIAGALGIPAIYQMFAKPFLGNTPIDSAINATYGRIPFLGKHIYGATDDVASGIQKIRDPGVRTHLLRTNSGVFSPNKTMHGSEAVKHHLMSNISAAPADRNNPLFKSIREMSTNPDSGKAYQRAVEEGRTANVNFDPQSRDRMMRGLSKKQKASVKKQNDEFLDAMVGAGTYGWRR